MRNLIQGHSIGLLGFLMGAVLIISGCGGSNNDSFVATGTPTSASATGSNTGSLTFNFTQAQTVEVPSSTTTLLFEFYDINNNLVFESESSFATSVTVAGIPVSAVRVEITAIDNTGVPLVEVTQEVDVTEDQTTTVDLTTAAVQPVTVASLSISPSTSTLDEGSTVALVVSEQLRDIPLRLERNRVGEHGRHRDRQQSGHGKRQCRLELRPRRFSCSGSDWGR